MKTLGCPADLDGLQRRIRALAPDHPASWGRMSVDQMVCHLSDGCRMATGEIAVAALDVGTPTLRKWIALWLPLRWPAGLPTCPEIDQHAGGGTRPVRFAADVAVLLGLVDQLASAPGLESRAHTVFGRMSQVDWLRWAYLHVNHHLRQFGA